MLRSGFPVLSLLWFRSQHKRQATGRVLANSLLQIERLGRNVAPPPIIGHILDVAIRKPVILYRLIRPILQDKQE